MKTDTFLFAVIFLLIGSFTHLNAQNDVIFKTDGNEMMGKVVEMSPTEVEFIINNETVQQTVPKNEIVKITFASGRTEFMERDLNSKESATKSNTRLSDHHNKFAILPFAYFKDRRDGSNGMLHKIQDKTYSIYNRRKKEFQFQDPKTTNALLAKSGVYNIADHTIDEICDILNVEYVVQGSVSIEQTGQSSSYKTTRKEKFEIESPKRSGLIETSLSDTKETGSANTKTNYATSIMMEIYNDKGENIYNKDHYTLHGDANSYKTMLKYLAKRSPIYSK